MSPATGSRADGIVVEIVDQIAKRDGVNPWEIDPPLYDIVDPDALERLFVTADPEEDRYDGYVRFQYCGYDVTVTADGDVAVSGRGLRSDRPSIERRAVPEDE